MFISTIFSQHSPNFARATEGDRKDILYDVVNLEKFTSYFDFTKSKSKQIKVEIGSTEVLLSSTLSSIKDKNIEIEDTKNSMYGFDIDIDFKIDGVQGEIKELQEESIIEIEDTIRAIQESLDIGKDYTDEKESVEREIREYNIEREKIWLDIDNIKGRIAEVTDSICPVLDKECVELVSRKQEVIDKYVPKKGKLEKEYEEAQIKCKRVEKKLKRIGNLIVQERELEDRLSKLRLHKERIVMRNSSIKKNKQLLIERIEELQLQDNPYMEIAQREEKKLEELKTKATLLKKGLGGHRETLKYYEFWKSGFSKQGIPNLKCETFIATLEDKTNEILSGISDRMYVSIDSQSHTADQTVREKIAYKVHHPDKYISNIASYSEGQKQRIKLADILAFNSLVGQFDFLFLDEVLDMSLDNIGKEDVIRLLQIKAREIGSIFVVSHDSTIKDSFKHFIKVKETNGISRLV